MRHPIPKNVLKCQITLETARQSFASGFFSVNESREKKNREEFFIDSLTRWRKKLARILSEGPFIHSFELRVIFGSILFGGNYFLVVILFSLPGFFWFQPVSTFCCRFICSVIGEIFGSLFRFLSNCFRRG